MAPGPAKRSDGDRAAQLTAADIAFGYPYGVSDTAFPNGLPTGTPLAALEGIIAAELGNGPLYVSFSGGIDSSLILGAAVAVARRYGAPDPVPITWRFGADEVARADERDWQEAVVAELGLADWERLDAGGRLGWLGHEARGFLRRQGAHYPPNTFVHAPLAEVARGGTLLTGVGGDQILGLWRGRHAAALMARRRPPRRGDARDLLRVAMPGALRSEVHRRRSPVASLNWLTPPAQTARRHSAADEDALDPFRWDHHLRWRWLRRDIQLSVRSLEALGRDGGTRVLAPFLNPSFVDALAVAGGRLGAGNRTETIARWLAPALPAAVRTRRDKARFPGVFWRPETRAAAQQLIAAGCVVDTALVDSAALIAEWRREQPHHGSSLLLQYTWLTGLEPGPNHL